MQRVDKKQIMIYGIFLLISLLFIVGCAQKKEYTSTSRSYHNNITKDHLLHAVKRVFFLADKGAFIIDSYRNDLNVTKAKAVNKFYTMDIRNDHFDFEVKENDTNATLKATFSISRTYGINKENREYEDSNSSVYKLFWNRVDYLLGKQKEWSSCNYATSKGFFCDIVDLENEKAAKENLIDLNTTKQDTNATEKIIDLSTIYKKEIPKNKMKKETIKEEIYVTKNKDDAIATKKSDNVKTDVNNETVKSFKIPVNKIDDTNTTLLINRNNVPNKIEDLKNIDTNTTKE